MRRSRSALFKLASSAMAVGVLVLGVGLASDAAAQARVDVDFLSGPSPTGTFQAPSEALTAEKVEFGTSRAARWFGL